MITRFARLIPRSLRKFAIDGLVRALDARRLLPLRANSYSQCGEDRILAFLFAQLDIKTPSYFDVGTCHPTNINNTYLFYQRGSAGVCVEPNPDMVPQISLLRPRDKLLNVGLSPHAGSTGGLTYHMFSEPSLNTFDAEEARLRAVSGRNPIVRQITVPTMDIRTVMETYFSSGPDLISLDAEGMDLALLKAMDYEARRPLAICVETVGYSECLAKPKLNEISDFLESQGYILFADTFVNGIYVDRQRTGSLSV